MSEKIKPADVINYLNENPDFFSRYPDLLEGLKVTSERGQLTSLVQHQVQVLQKKQLESNHKLQALIENARANEALMDKLFELLCELAVAPDAAFIGRYLEFVRGQFPTDFFRLYLSSEYHPETRPDELHDDADVRPHLGGFQQSAAPICGRLSAEMLTQLFPQEHAEVKSAVVLPVGDQARFGVMVFGSRDQEKFHPHSSTDILQKLVSILAGYLHRQSAENAHQAVG